MIAMPMVLLVARATLVLVAAAAIARAMSRRSASARCTLWSASLASLLVLPLLGLWSPARTPLTIPQALVGDRAPSALAVESPLGEERRPPERAVARLSTATPATSARTAPFDRPTLAARTVRPGTIAAAVWIVVALGLLLSLVRSWLAARRIVRHATPASGPEWSSALDDAATRIGLTDAPMLVCSPDISMPFVCGLLRPVVVLPPESDGWSAQRREAVLLHELAHVRRHDVLVHLSSRVISALYWFHPLVWFAAHRLRAESERACDDVALMGGAAPADYAEHVLDLASRAGASATPAAGIALARHQEFEGRVLAILDPSRARAALKRHQVIAIWATLPAIALLIGAQAPTLPTRELAGPAATREEQPRLARTDSGSLGSMLALLEAPDPRVRESAIATVGHLRDRRAVSPVAAVLRTDDVPQVRRMAAWALGTLESNGAVVPLARAVTEDVDADVREMSAWSLGWSDMITAVALEALGRAARGDGDERVREMSAWALHRARNHGAATQALAAVLAADRSANVRATAAWAIGFVRARVSPVPLVQALDDESEAVRLRAAWALGRIDGAVARDALRRRLPAERNVAVRGMMSASLDRRNDVDIDDIVDRTMKDQAPAGPSPWPRPRPRPLPWALDAGKASALQR